MIESQRATDTFRLEDVLPDERARLVRLCAHFSGDRDAAEDLAQETLIEAWRHQERLIDHAGYAHWLSAIARNVCMRWSRRCGRERSFLALPGRSDQGTIPPLEELPGMEDDITVELERDQLADLLDRALGLLPRETRRVLVEKYVDETPLAEIAARLNLSAGAAAVRLHRGRLALHRVLTTELRHELAPYGLIPSQDEGWQPTRIWCPLCGTGRLLGRLERSTGELALRCPNCLPMPDAFLAYSGPCEPLRGLKGYRPALARLMILMDDYYRRKLVNRMVPCPTCGRPTQLRDGAPAGAPPLPAQLGALHNHCEDCNSCFSTARAAIALAMPEGREFWRKHPRIRFRPGAEIETHNQQAIVSSFESATGSARLDVVTARHTFEVISVHKIP